MNSTDRFEFGLIREDQTRIHRLVRDLDIPVEIGKDDGSLVFEANDKKIPPLGSKVWVIMSPVK